jgi:hypothetical protein
MLQLPAPAPHSAVGGGVETNQREEDANSNYFLELYTLICAAGGHDAVC